MNLLAETMRACEAMAAKHETVVVAYSDGKDARVAMDLCARTFRRIEAFYMYLVPGLAVVEAGLEAAQTRWNVRIRQYPHWSLGQYTLNGLYCHPADSRDRQLTPLKVHDVYALAMADTGASVVVTGAKKADSLWRRRAGWNWKHREVFQPLERWTKFDVHAYLKRQGIGVPAEVISGHSGIDLSPPSLLWLHDRHPEDFARVREFFPFVDALIWQREFYGTH